MASYDIDSIMAEHGLTRDEAGEVLRVLKSGATTPAVDTLYLFSVFYILLFLFLKLFGFSSGRVLHLHATPSPSNRSQRIKFPLSTGFCVLKFFVSVFSHFFSKFGRYQRG